MVRPGWMVTVTPGCCSSNSAATIPRPLLSEVGNFTEMVSSPERASSWVSSSGAALSSAWPSSWEVSLPANWS